MMNIKEEFRKFMSQLDFEEKVVGDKVKIVSKYVLIYLIDETTGKQIEGLLHGDLLEDNVDLIENEAIVSRTDIGFEFLCGNCDEIHKADTEIYYPHNKKKYFCREKELKKV